MKNLELQGDVSEEKINNEEYLKIKDDLLSGELSLREFREKIIELDQSNIFRTKSISNLELLRDPEVVNFIFSKNDLEAESYYKKLLSLTEFHAGQVELNNKENKGVVHIKEALRIAEESDDDSRWINYLKGTVFYLNGQEIPKEILEEVKDSDNNYKILKSFNRGLKERGYPEYLVDYKI